MKGPSGPRKALLLRDGNQHFQLVYVHLAPVGLSYPKKRCAYVITRPYLSIKIITLTSRPAPRSIRDCLPHREESLCHQRESQSSIQHYEMANSRQAVP